MTVALGSRRLSAVNVGSDRLQPCEAGECLHFAQPVELNHCVDRIRALRSPPGAIRQASGMEVRVHRNVVAEAFGCREQCVELATRGAAFHADILTERLLPPTLSRAHHRADVMMASAAER
jgi:hypothetical protein